MAGGEKKASARASPNIALVKYWGKRDETLNLPSRGSISMTVGGLYSHTTLAFEDDLEDDELTIDGEWQSGEPVEKAKKVLKAVREMAGFASCARIVSRNSFPTGAGLASSASGLAALTIAAASAAGFDPGKEALSVIARRGSGSACRSIHGGFVEWVRGEKSDGSDSFGVEIAPPSHWDVSMVIAVVSPTKKEFLSTVGMRATQMTSPFHNAFLESVDSDLPGMRKAILERDISMVGRIAERNAMRMHAAMMAADPPLIYFLPATLGVISAVRNIRKRGLDAYFTIDAGPNVKVICESRHAAVLGGELLAVHGVRETLVCKVGEGASITGDHLF